MGLIDFFRINMPYGMKKSSEDKWFLFNREYVPLGWTSKANAESIFGNYPYSKYPIHSKYIGLTDSTIFKIIQNKDLIKTDDDGKIISFHFYDDRSNPKTNPLYWDSYFDIIKALSKLEV